MSKIKTVLNSIAIFIIILFITCLAYFLGSSVYLVFALYVIVAAYGFYKRYWDLILGIFWAFAAHIGFNYWAAYVISQIN